MPKYDYVCPDCGASEERTVSVDERDEQFCKAVYDVLNPEAGRIRCNCKMIRQSHFNTLQFDIPEHFKAGNETTNADILPSSAESRKTWEECGVRRRGSQWV